MNLDSLFSEDCNSFMPSPVRDIFKKVDLNEIYSFAGGYPNADSFPLDDIERLSKIVLEKYGTKALQYGATQGLTELREALSQRYHVPTKNIQISTSSQQGIDVCSRIFINPQDTILCINPCYLGAIQSFKSYRADIQGIEYSQDIEIFKQNITKVINNCISQDKKIKFLYVISDFQNPSGQTLSLAERELLLSFARSYDFLIIEDSPYKELRYEGDDIKSIYELDTERVIFLGSFSKIFAPAFRLGWIFANEKILEKIYVCKQSLDLCPPVFDQYLTSEYINSGLLDKNLEKSRKLYKGKRDLVLKKLEECMPDCVSWNKAEGGLFLFLYLPESFNALTFYELALKEGLAYVAGNFFYTDGSGLNTIRLNFSFMSDEKLEKGIELFSSLLKKVLN